MAAEQTSFHRWGGFVYDLLRYECHLGNIGSTSSGILNHCFNNPDPRDFFNTLSQQPTLAPPGEVRHLRLTYGVWKRVVTEVEQFQKEEPASQLLPRDRAVALRRRNPEKTLAGLLDGNMGSAFVFIAALRVPCSTGSAPTSLRRR